MIILVSSCSNKEAIVTKYLYENGDAYKKNSFEILSMKLIDTLYKDDRYKLDNPSEFYEPKGEDQVRVENTRQVASWRDSIPVRDDSNGQYYGPLVKDALYIKELYTMLAQITFLDESGRWNDFLSPLGDLNFDSFKSLLLKNPAFKANFLSQVNHYAQFNGSFSPDSIRKHIQSETFNSNQMLASIYVIKYRKSMILEQQVVFFDMRGKEVLLTQLFKRN